MPIYDPTNVLHCPDLITSLVFIYEGREYFILSPVDGLPYQVRYLLRRKIDPIHFMTEFEQDHDGNYKCTIEGTDGSCYKLKFTPEAVFDNMTRVSGQIEGPNV